MIEEIVVNLSHTITYPIIQENGDINDDQTMNDNPKIDIAEDENDQSGSKDW